SRSARIHAIFQPHGFTQTRLLRDDYRQVFQTELRPEDRLHLLDIYFAGGPVTRNVSSADLVADLAGAPFEARVAPDRHALCALIATEVEAGDLVLLMGARDPSLGAFARQLIASL
ncbi:MAG: hypothetical protein KDB18_12740, partial [Salinibacterium sp.]|nr:hypothetical protein [Salinibacterium sp.]